MKTRTAIAITLAGILGLTGSVKIMNHAQELQQDYKQVVPARLGELSTEIRDISTRNLSMESYCEHPEIFEQYKRLREEQKAILNNPEIKRAVEDYDLGTIERVAAGGLSIPSSILGLFGACSLIADYRKNKCEAR